MAKETTQKWAGYLSNKHQKFKHICPCGLGPCPFSDAPWGYSGCPLSGIEKCPVLRGSDCFRSTGRAIGEGFVHC